MWAVIVCGLTICGSAAARDPALELPERYERSPYSLMTLSVGFPNRGRLIRGIRLKPTAYLKIKADSAANAYGHPALVKMLKRSARDLKRASKESVMLVGDLSKEAGGKLPKHGSHQSGRDADVGFYARDKSGKPIVFKSFVRFGKNGKAVDHSGLVFDDWRNWLLVQSWLRDERAIIQQVYVAHWLRKRLLDFASSRKGLKRYVPAAEKLLVQPLRASAHDDHFHVRIRCPKRQGPICRDASVR